MESVLEDFFDDDDGNGNNGDDNGNNDSDNGGNSDCKPDVEVNVEVNIDGGEGD